MSRRAAHGPQSGAPVGAPVRGFLHGAQKVSGAQSPREVERPVRKSFFTQSLMQTPA